MKYTYYVVYQTNDGTLGCRDFELDRKLNNAKDIISLSRAIERQYGFEHKSTIITNFILLD